MKMKSPNPDFKFILLVFAYLTILKPVFSQTDYKPTSEWAWGKEDSTEYFIYTPGNLELGKRYPIALYLHGCCGDSPHAIPHRAADPPVRMWHNFDENTQDIPTYIISPQTTRGWNQHFENIKKVIDYLVEKRQGDPQRIYIVGFSMGGRGLFEFISKYPDYFAAAMPIGMSFFNGDFDKVKHIPIWTNQGSEDRWARELYKFVKETRALNGLPLDSAWEWVTGVSPRYTSFEGLGHLVQWETTTTQNLTEWAYSHVNDGNRYPSVYFDTPQYREVAKEGKKFSVVVNATDFDGSISKVDVYVNHLFHSSLTKAPYTTKIIPAPGDNLVEAIAFDNQGKTNTATSILAVDTKPTMSVSQLPYGRVGAYYSYWLPTIGNGEIIYSATGLPEGLILLPDGLMRGMPSSLGEFQVTVNLKDVDGDITNTTVTLSIKERRKGEVAVSNARNLNGNPLPVSKMVIGENYNFIEDKAPFSKPDKNSFGMLAGYDGLTFIKSEQNDTTLASETYMKFEIDQDAKIFVAYEKLDNILTSTIPEWLSTFNKQKNKQIAAQIHYFDIYSKDFTKGQVELPGGDKKNNGVSNNYFVMVQGKDFNNRPEINLNQLPVGVSGRYYSGQFSNLYGHGVLKWELVSGTLPEGLEVNNRGKVTGIPKLTGNYTFKIRITDEKGQSDESDINLEIK